MDAFKAAQNIRQSTRLARKKRKLEDDGAGASRPLFCDTCGVETTQCLACYEAAQKARKGAELLVTLKSGETIKLEPDFSPNGIPPDLDEDCWPLASTAIMKDIDDHKKDDASVRPSPSASAAASASVPPPAETKTTVIHPVLLLVHVVGDRKGRWSRSRTIVVPASEVNQYGADTTFTRRLEANKHALVKQYLTKATSPWRTACWPEMSPIPSTMVGPFSSVISMTVSASEIDD